MLLPTSQNFTKLAPSLILTFAYCFSFYCLALIAQKLPLAIIYASWAGLGVFSVAILRVNKSGFQVLRNTKVDQFSGLGS